MIRTVNLAKPKLAGIWQYTAAMKRLLNCRKMDFNKIELEVLSKCVDKTISELHHKDFETELSHEDEMILKSAEELRVKFTRFLILGKHE